MVQYRSAVRRSTEYFNPYSIYQGVPLIPFPQSVSSTQRLERVSAHSISSMTTIYLFSSQN